jgi:hypothetical protein
VGKTIRDHLSIMPKIDWSRRILPATYGKTWELEVYYTARRNTSAVLDLARPISVAQPPNPICCYST